MKVLLFNFRLEISTFSQASDFQNVNVADSFHWFQIQAYFIDPKGKLNVVETH